VGKENVSIFARPLINKS